MPRKLVAVLAVMLGMLVFAAVASAEPKVDSSQRLRVQVDPNQSGCASVDSVAGWVIGQDSPSDSNHRLFHTNVGTGGGCVLLFSNASTAISSDTSSGRPRSHSGHWSRHFSSERSALASRSWN